MPHADTSYFAPGLGKAEVYERVLEHAKALADGQRNWVTYVISTPLFSRSIYPPYHTNPPLPIQSNLSNTSSLLWHAYTSLPPPSSSVNWAGFYIRADKFPTPSTPTSPPTSTSTSTSTTLLLGPFQGKPACQFIAFGRGVCGTAAAEKRSVVVGDVSSFPGHIACDGESRSEIVVPVVVGGETVAIIDIDCAEFDGFDDVDRKALESLAVILGESCDW